MYFRENGVVRKFDFKNYYIPKIKPQAEKHCRPAEPQKIVFVFAEDVQEMWSCKEIMNETKQTVTAAKGKTDKGRAAASADGSTEQPKLSKRIREIIARGDIHEIAIETACPKERLEEEEIAALAAALSGRRGGKSIYKKYRAFYEISISFEKSAYPYRVEFERTGNQLIGFYRFIDGIKEGKKIAKRLCETHREYAAFLEQATAKTLSAKETKLLQRLREEFAAAAKEVESKELEEDCWEQIMIGLEDVKIAYTRFCNAAKGFSLWMKQEKDVHNKEYRFTELIKDTFLEKWMYIETHGEDYAYNRMPELSKTYLAKQQKKHKKVLPELARTAVFPLYQEIQPDMNRVKDWVASLSRLWQILTR